MLPKARTLYKIARFLYKTPLTSLEVLKNNNVPIIKKELAEIYVQKIQFQVKTILQTNANSSGLLRIMIISDSLLFIIKIDF